MPDSHTGLHPILVPVDFSEHSRAAIRFATSLAGSSGRPLLILHVVHDSGSHPGYYHRRAGFRRGAPLAVLASGLLEDFLATVRAEMPESTSLAEARTLVVEGLPADRILELSRRHDAAMVVMGSHGRTGFAHLLLGSVAERVSQLAAVPVTTVKAPKDQVEGDSAGAAGPGASAAA